MSDKHNPQARELEQLGQLTAEIAKFGGIDKRNASRLARILLPFVRYIASDAYHDGQQHAEERWLALTATPAPAGDVEELDLRIALGRIFGGELPAEPGPLRAQQHERWTNQILALFTASQPPVVEGEVDIREILDALVAREHGADNDMTVEKAEQLLAARQQSADEVRQRGILEGRLMVYEDPFIATNIRPEIAHEFSERKYRLIGMIKASRASSALTQRGEGGGKA